MTSNTENRRQIELLSEDNYSTWKIQMEALLVKNKLWDYVNEKMDDNTVEAEWFRNDKEAKCELILSISPSELKYIRNCETSYEMWNELKSIYESRDKAKKTTLLKQLVLHHSTNDTDMAKHTTEFCNIVNKLNKMNVEIDEELLVIIFMQSLPPAYNNFKYAIELQKKLPTFEVLIIKIMDDIKVRSRKSQPESIEFGTTDHINIELPL